MKKVILFLSVIMFAFTGILFACNDERYSDLEISVSSITSQTSGNKIAYNRLGDNDGYYEVIYGDTFIVDATVECSNDISTTLIFNSESSESLNHIRGLDTNTENGTKATFKATAPSYDTYFNIKISSYEATNKQKTVKVKVVLPLERIDLNENLGLAANSSMNLNDQVIYTSSIPSIYETNEKGAEFRLTTFNSENLFIENLNGNQDGDQNYEINYYLDEEKTQHAFNLKNGVVTVVDDSLEGKLGIEAISTKKFDKNLEKLELSGEASDDQLGEILANNKYKAATTVTVVKSLKAEDFDFEGGQVGYKVKTATPTSKLNASLYINSTDTYVIKNTTYNYNFEKVNLSIATSQQIKIDAIVGDVTIDGVEFVSDKGVISNIDSDEIVLAKTSVGYATDLMFKAEGSNGIAYVDFIITYTQFNNKLEYRFSDLYNKWLDTLDADLTGIDRENPTLTFNCSAIPVAISVLQDGKEPQGNPPQIQVYDTYENAINSSVYGTKLSVDLVLSAGLTNLVVDESNSKIKVYLNFSEGGANVNDYIEIRDHNFNRIILNQQTRQSGTCYGFEMNLMNKQTSYFYVKANKENLAKNAVFNFEFETCFDSLISTFSGIDILPGATNTTLKNLTAIVKAKTVKGVENIIGVVKNAENYYEVDNKNLTAQPLYQQLTLKLNASGEVVKEAGSLIGIFVNDYVEEELNIKVVDENIAEICSEYIDGESVFGAYLSSYNEKVKEYNLGLLAGEKEKLEIKLNKAISIVGLNIGTTTVEISSANGYMVVIQIKVVNPVNNANSDFSFEAKQGYSKVVYQNKLNDQFDPYISAKVNGKFNILWSVKTGTSGVLGVAYDIVNYETNAESKAVTIDRNTGLVTTRSAEKLRVKIIITYFVFDNTSGYYEWSESTFEKSFVLEVFEPATMFRLTNNGISNVYSYDSLGYKDKKLSLVNIGVIISPINATINGLKDKNISYVIDSNSNNLRGVNGAYTAYLQPGQDRAIEYVTVYITEFGHTTTLKYTVNIFRAVQVEEIQSTIFEDEKEVSQHTYAFDRNTISIKTTKNQTLLFNTAISPAKVYNDDLVVKIFKAANDTAHTFTTNEFTANPPAELFYGSQSGQTIILDNGKDRFDLKTHEQAGYFYVVIFASDSMTADNVGKVYQRYIVEVTDGSLQSPYVVETAQDLIDIAKDPTKHYVLGADINLSYLANWTPIANFSGSLNGFNGSTKEDPNSELDGTFYKITGLKICYATSIYTGLFGNIVYNDSTGQCGAVMNLSLEVESINLNDKSFEAVAETDVYIGSIVGLNAGIISNCSVSFKEISVNALTKNVFVGGMVGGNGGVILNFPHNNDLTSASYADQSNPDIIDRNTYINNYDLSYSHHVNTEEYLFTSLNPVNGNLYVSDSENHYTYAGGMVGINHGVINGIHGYYTYLEENLANGSDVVYKTAYQSQGTDVKVNINNKESETYNLINLASAVGGVVGYGSSGNADPKISNISADVSVGYFDGNNIKGVCDKVGGIVGYAQNTTIFNVLVSGKIRACDSVGGIVGFGEKVGIERARVENYEDIYDNSDYAQTMILAYNNIGGIAGKLTNSNVETAYSHSYVSLLNQSLIKNPDIVSIGNDEDANVGGVVGSIKSTGNTDEMLINAAFSTFGIKTTNTSNNVGGIVGAVEQEQQDKLTIKNVYYIGVTNSNPLIGRSNLTIEPGGYYFYYVLKYVDSTDVKFGTNYDAVIIKEEYQEDIGALDNNDNAKHFNDGKTDVPYEFYVSEVEGNGLKPEKKTINTKVLAYNYGQKFNFVKNIPSAISATIKEGKIEQVVDFKLDLTNNAEKYFYYYYDANNSLHLIARYALLDHAFELKDLFNIIPSPNMAGRINIIVKAIQDKNIVSITDNGQLILNNTGSAVLQFSVRENVSAVTHVFIDVIKSFDEVLLSNLTNFNTSIINTEETAFNTRKYTDVNIYSLLGEYVDISLVKDKLVYRTIEQNRKTLYLIQIDQYNFYTLIFEVKINAGEGSYIATSSECEIEGSTIRFKKEGLYQVKVSLAFNLLDAEQNVQQYQLINENWLLYFNVYSGATSIKFDTKSFGLTGNSVKTDLKLTLITDEVVDGGLEESLQKINLHVKTDNLNDFNYNYNDGIVIDGDNIIYITPADVIHDGQSHTYTFHIGIAEKYRNLSEIRTFTIYAYDISENGSSVFENTPAMVSVSLNPKGVNGISGIHYTYTQKASKLEIDANTNEAFGNGAGDANFSYSFTNEPKNTVIAGNEGLFVVDITPYYSNITSVSIKSSLNPQNGNSLQFVQLVKISDGSDAYYIYAPQTKATEDERGIYLNKYSYIPFKIATINTIGGNYTIDQKETDIKYGFGKNFYDKTGALVDGTAYEDDTFVKNNNDSEVGRLYVKTIAPSNLEEEEVFELYITVKYMAVGEDGVLREFEELYIHKLYVESVPGLTLSINHDGKERNVIAYTGTNGFDYLDIVPTVDKGYTFKSITGALYAGGKIDGVGDSSSDLFTLEDISQGKGKRLILGEEARVGDIIVISVTVSIEYEGYIETRLFKFTIRVVDVVIENVSIKDIGADNTLKITVSTSKQLKVVIDGYGTKEAIENAEMAISRSIDYQTNSINYWFAKSNRSGEYYVNLDSAVISNQLPFNVQKVSVTNQVESVTVSESCIGAQYTELNPEIKVLPKLVVLEGSTSSGTVDMQLKFSYVYLDKEYGNSNPKSGSIVFVPNSFKTSFTCQAYFTVQVTEDSNEDNPFPIYTAEELVSHLNGAKGGDYILMEDITLTNHTAIKAEFNSFDGNNKIITIENFAYNPNLSSSSNTRYSINMGLFDTVSANTVVKNIIVALPNDKTSAMNLKGYISVNFGGIAAVNNGIITNCDVITKTNEENVSLVNYKTYSYTLNIETSMLINNDDVTANIGLLVGLNESTGYITNSRVGRESVDVLTVYDSDSTVVYKSKYAYTAPMTLIRVYGRANVGGFVASNDGTIASSYARNLQLEINSISSKDFVKIGGFVVNNTGFIHGSYVAGWEESYIKNTSNNRKLGGGIYTNGFIGGFVYRNESYIEDCYSNINLSGSLEHAADTTYISYLKNGVNKVNYISPAVGGFVYSSTANSLITTSYSLSKISSTIDNNTALKSNTHAAFEGRMESSDINFVNEGVITNSYFIIEKGENFNYDHEQAAKLSDNPSISLDNNEEIAGINEFINKESFNSFSFDNDIQNLRDYEGTSTGGVWAIYLEDGSHGYPDLISANKVAISARVINVTKTNNSETNKYYYTYVDGYEAGSTNNPYIISNFEQYNNIFKDAVGNKSFNDNVTTKFTGNIRLVKHINFGNSLEVYSTTVEYTSLVNQTSVFDGNYMAMYNINLSDKSSGRDSFGLFKDIYYAGVKNLTLVVSNVYAANTTSVGALAGVIVNSNVSNVTLAAAKGSGVDFVLGSVTGNNYVGALAGIIVSSDLENQYTISNIKSNLSIVGNVNTGYETNAITASSIVWERIKPSATSSGLSSLNANLRLHKLPVNVYYAGGIAGIIALHQMSEVQGEVELNTVNAYNVKVGQIDRNTNLSTDIINFQNDVSVISDYTGGLFGMLGSETYLEVGSFISKQENEDHYLSAREIAGGITAVNFGKISQSELTFSKEEIIDLDKNLINYVSIDNLTEVCLNSTLFTGSPKYIGGIAGINIGNNQVGTGNILDSYSRVNVKNTNAIGVGGIAGGSYIGQISNVYTTASLMGNLSNSSLKIGAIIGKIFEDSEEGYFADYKEDGSMLQLKNIVAVNLWDVNDFDALYTYVRGGGKIGALYGEYKNKKDESDEDLFIKLDQSVYVQNYVLKNLSDARVAREDEFNILDLDINTYFELWGVAPNTRDLYLEEILIPNQNSENLIEPNDLRALLSSSKSTLRETYFSSARWPRTIWNYDQYWQGDVTKPKILPNLQYGYESNVIRIYTAHQFIDKLNTGFSSGKLFVIMNDIDFGGIDNLLDSTPINPTFKGQLYGNNIVYQSEGKTYVRKPILFNLNFNQSPYSNSISAIFQNAIGATFSNFNIVLKNYRVVFNGPGGSNEQIASVLVGNAINTTINNVHIYDSLTSNVNQEISGDGYLKNQTLTGSDPVCVTQGYELNDGVIVKYSDPFLKLATANNNCVTPVEEFDPSEHIYLTRNGDYFVISSYTNTNDNVSYSSIDEIKASDLPSYLKGLKVEIAKGTVTTNANVFGLFTGTSSLSYISNSSVNVSKINLSYGKERMGATLYVGAMVGKYVGEMQAVASTSKITMSNKEGAEKPSISAAYIGGLLGSAEGVIRHAYLKDTSITLGSNDNDNQIVQSSGNAGIYAGGVAGSIDSYSTINEAVVGGVNYIYLTNSKINAHIIGTSVIGGVFGQNGFTIGDIEYVVTDLSSESLCVNLDGDQTSSIVGGIVGQNKSTSIYNIYTNASVKVVNNANGAIKISGIVGYSDNSLKFDNVICDANQLNYSDSGTTKTKGKTLSIGAFIAENSNTSGAVLLNNVLNSTDIIADQAQTMNVGGMIGHINGDLTVTNGIQLGDIYLHRTNGFDGNYGFYENEHYIGGLAGHVNSLNQDAENTQEGFVVLTTIKDYAQAQKTNLNLGPVIGKKCSVDVSILSIYYNENISLASNNGYKLSHLAQTAFAEKTKLVFDDLHEIWQVENINIDKTKSHYGTKFIEDGSSINSGSYKVGTKLNPKVFDGSIEEDDYYYIMTGDYTISAPINTDAENWMLNAQGNTINYSGNIFDTITENSAVVGLLQNKDVTLTTSSAVIATTNKGFIFSCGVSGEVTSTASLASIAFTNEGVISTTFSIANLSGDSAIAGLVVYNYSEDGNAGGIYNSYFTGTITPCSGGSGGINYAGLVLRSSDDSNQNGDTECGFVSNCYTMADINTTVENFIGNAYPVTASGNAKLYKVFYDYVAFTGSSDNEGVNINAAKDSNYITNKGIYVWSGSLSDGSAPDSLEDILEGSWLTPGNVDLLKALYEKSNSHTNNQSEDVVLETSWFNYGYITSNFINIIDISNKSNVDKYLTMLYTGNGLAKKDNEDIKTNGFVNCPYKIKHAGMLEVLVNSNNTKNGILYKYYIFVKSIDFIKYTDTTYWSQTWDDNKIAFLGDLDGADNSVLNMYSTHGLLRAVINEVDEISYVKNITFFNCYAKTGLIAGFLNSSSTEGVARNNKAINDDQKNIDNVTVKNSLVYNGDITDLDLFKKGASIEENFGEKTISSITIKNGTNEAVTYGKKLSLNNYANFAGGLVGYMYGGIIGNNCTFNNLSVASSNVDSSNNTDAVDLYVGGLVGIMVNGVIANYADLKGITVSSVNTNSKGYDYVGGVAGFIGTPPSGAEVTIYNMTVNGVTVRGYHSVGAIAGIIENAGNSNSGIINTAFINEGTTITATDTKISGSGENGFSFENNEITDKFQDGRYYGGVVGIANNAVVSGCNVSTGLGIDVSGNDVYEEIALGGVVGKSENSSSISNCGVWSAITIDENFSNKIVITAGIAGIVNGGTIEGNRKLDINTVGSDNSTISGGIVGKITNGTIKNCTVGEEEKIPTINANKHAGGIVGYVDAQSSSTVKIIDDQEATKKQLYANVNGSENSGGVVGCITSISCGGTIEIKISGWVVNGDIGENSTVSGGIVGYSYNENDVDDININSNTNKAPVKTGKQYIQTGDLYNKNIAGGIVGVAVKTAVDDNTNNGEVSDAFIASGVVGLSSASNINAATNTANVTGTRAAAGIVGWFDDGSTISGNITNDNSSAVINVTDSGLHVSDIAYGVAGGIIALFIDGSIANDDNITNNMSIGGEATASTTFTSIAGGIIGCYNKTTNSTLNLAKTTNSGSVLTGSNKTVKFSTYILYSFSKESFDIAPKIKQGKDERYQSLSADKGFADAAPKDIAGGIVGYANKTLHLSGAQTNNNLNAAVVSINYAGGIVGYANTDITITNVVNAQNVLSNCYAGGILSEANSENVRIIATYDKTKKQGESITDIDDSNFFGSVTNTGVITAKYSGGIVGSMSNGNIGDSYPVEGNTISNTGTITSTNASGGAGGIVGFMSGGTIGAIPAEKVNLEFKNINGGGTIKSSVEKGKAGGVVGYMEAGTISYAQSSATKVEALEGYVGGIVGYMSSGTISNTQSSATEVTATNGDAGGVVGKMTGGNIKATNIKGANLILVTGRMVGGLVGTMNEDNASSKIFEDCTIGSSVTLNGENDFNSCAGGVVGYFTKGTIEHNSWTNISFGNLAYHAGGLVGYMAGDETLSLSGTVDSMVKAHENAGGFVGFMAGGTIVGGEADGGFNGSAENVGGLVGYMAGGTIGTNGDTTGLISSEKNADDGKNIVIGKNVGGFIGHMTGGEIKGGKVERIIFASYAIYTENIGGLVGKMTGGEISGGKADSLFVYCTNSSIELDYAGGLVGYMSGEAKITGGGDETQSQIVEASANFVGGIVGGMFDSSEITGGYGGKARLAGYGAGGIAGEMNNNSKIKGGTGGDLPDLVYNAPYFTWSGGIVALMYDDSEILGGTGGNVYSGTYRGGIVSFVDGKAKISGGVGGNIESTENNAVAGGIAARMAGESEISGGTGGKITGSFADVGGIVGIMESATAKVTGGTAKTINCEADYVGGIAGIIERGKILDAHSPKTVKSTKTGSYVGGIVGGITDVYVSKEAEEVVISCSPSTQSKIEGHYVGGIIGYMEGYVVFAANVMDIELISRDDSAGGVVGIIATYKASILHIIGDISINCNGAKAAIVKKVPTASCIYGGYSDSDGVVNNINIDLKGVKKPYGLTVEVESYGIISNLNVVNVNIEAKDSVGGITNKNKGLITDCYVKGTIKTIIDFSLWEQYVGGIAGINEGGNPRGSAEGGIYNCVNDATVMADIESADVETEEFGIARFESSLQVQDVRAYVGGIAGKATDYSITQGENGENAKIKGSSHYSSGVTGSIVGDNIVASASITDYRGQIIGRIDGVSVKYENTSGFTDFSWTGEAPKKEIDDVIVYNTVLYRNSPNVAAGMPNWHIKNKRTSSIGVLDPGGELLSWYNSKDKDWSTIENWSADEHLDEAREMDRNITAEELYKAAEDELTDYLYEYDIEHPGYEKGSIIHEGALINSSGKYVFACVSLTFTKYHYGPDNRHDTVGELQDCGGSVSTSNSFPYDYLVHTEGGERLQALYLLYNKYFTNRGVYETPENYIFDKIQPLFKINDIGGGATAPEEEPETPGGGTNPTPGGGTPVEPVDGDLASVALSFKGNTASQCGVWDYGYNWKDNWCCMFVYMCADMAGKWNGTVANTSSYKVDQYSMPAFFSCTNYMNKAEEQNPQMLIEKGEFNVYTPKRNDLMFIDWVDGGWHVAIITDYDPVTKTIYTIEGNRKDNDISKSIVYADEYKYQSSFSDSGSGVAEYRFIDMKWTW